MTKTTDDVRRELRSVVARLTVLEEDLPTSVKTVGRHDFTGYGKESLGSALLFLSSAANLPGPLNVVRIAIEGAYRQVTGKDWVAPAAQATNPILPSSTTTTPLSKGSKLRALALRHRDGEQG